jgi:alpha-tubulin suppressor-like RCC1 family protein
MVLVAFVIAAGLWGCGNNGGAKPEWVSVSAGRFHTVGVKSDGSLYTWGDNKYGQLGDGTLVSKASPTRIESDSDWLSVSAGPSFTLALKKNGSLYAWGAIMEYVPDSGKSFILKSPVRIGSDSDWAMVSAGFSTLALKKDGSLYKWSLSDFIRPSGEDATFVSIPPTRIGSDTDWMFISAGNNFYAAIKKDGSLYTWGKNYNGQLGLGYSWSEYLENPTRVGEDTDWASVSAGTGNHCVALKKDGSLYGWGGNIYGGLGEATSNLSVPTRMGTDSQWISASAGDTVTSAVSKDGSIQIWGKWPGISLENNSVTALNADGMSPWAAISTGRFHAVALKKNGTLYSWGWRWYGQVGNGSTGNGKVQIPLKTDKNWSAVSTGYEHALLLKTDGSLYACGNNRGGQLGDGSGEYRYYPGRIGTESDWKSVSAGAYHSTGLKQDGSLFTWGSNSCGQLGDGTLTQRSTPVQVGGAGEWAAVSAGMYQTFAVKKDGTLYTWGIDNNDFTNYNSMILSPQMIGYDSDWVDVSAGDENVIALKSDGSIYVWGYADHGVLGPVMYYYYFPTPIMVGYDFAWKSATLGEYHVLLVKNDGSLYSWGENYGGTLGLGDDSIEIVSTPTRIGNDSNWTCVSGTMAIKDDGTLYVWGENIFGNLGLVSGGGAIYAPQRMGSDSDWARVSTRNLQTFAIKTDGSLYMWGSDNYGQLGDDTAWVNSPEIIH